MGIALALSFLFVLASQIGVAWVLSFDLWFLKGRPWLAALGQYVIGFVTLSIAMSVASLIGTAIVMTATALDMPLSNPPPVFLSVLLFTGYILLAVRLIRLARAQQEVLRWQATAQGNAG